MLKLKASLIQNFGFQYYRKFASLTTHQKELMAKGLPKKSPLKNVDNIVIVASGKGGVGKSTTAVNLAVTLSHLGKRVGLLDADIFGPSIPLMMNLNEPPLVNDFNLMIPPINYGVKCLSMGLLVEKGPVVWRGPLVMSALQRLLKGTVWGPLDILIVDTPPGTGDVHLSLAQNVPISGIVLVSTPQVAALEVTRRGAEMYKTLKAPIIGLVENMGSVTCTNCFAEIKLFGQSTIKFCEKMSVRILETLPMEGRVIECSDTGIPIVVQDPNSNFAKIYIRIANQVIEFLNAENKKESVQI